MLPVVVVNRDCSQVRCLTERVTTIMAIVERSVKLDDRLVTGHAIWSGYCQSEIAFVTSGLGSGYAAHDGITLEAPSHKGFVEVKISDKGGTWLNATVDGADYSGFKCLGMKFCGNDQVAAAAALFAFLGEELTRSIDTLDRDGE